MEKGLTDLEKAIRIAQAIKNGTRTMVLLYDDGNDPTPFVSFPITEDIEDNLIQGTILKRLNVVEFGVWLEQNPTHKFNNQIKQLTFQELSK